MISSPDASFWTWGMHSANVSVSAFVTPVPQHLMAFHILASYLWRTELLLYLICTGTQSTDRPGISTQESEWRGVICDSIKLARTGNKGSFSTGLISREQALQSHWTLPWALGYALTFSRLSLRQHSGRRTAVVMTLPYDCVGHSTFKIC